ncbi:nickel/cobalt exporter [Methylocapsa palsarum]|uniref:Nickel/cobalt efflux system n=2 Tax=Methylocapsa palsarum TaxID=1612308 RepID=A0A1I3YMK8_9HYPH|nr:nickel/cobalt exporter [Methylocapsa palsarum]
MFGALSFRKFLKRPLSSPLGLLALCGGALACAASGLDSAALAQGVHHPFAVGANEGAVGATNGLGGWILTQESGFYRLLTGAIRAAKDSGLVASGLIGLSFAYGVFHAAGPGHGKTVLTSYMLANENMLRRGLAISLAAALLQGLVAVTIVGVAAFIFGATSKRMTAASNAVEIASYAAIALLGAALLARKGSALIAAWKSGPVQDLPWQAPPPGAPSRFAADDCSLDHTHGPGCGHFHAPDPRSLGEGFSWRNAALSVVAAGSRPCSGAILVLVFALAQGVFLTGVGAVLAMSLGTAITTGALASLAVFAKKSAVKFARPGSRRALVAGALFEAGAALAVLLLGLTLLAAALAGVGRGGG